MGLYFDTSALSPLFVPDVHSERIYCFLATQDGRSTVSSLTMIELASMVSRNVRTRRMSDLGAQDSLARAAQWAAQKSECVELVAIDYAIGETYVRRFDLGLRAPDALHVAICGRLGLTLLTCDVAQAKAARALGIETIELFGGPS